MSAATLEPATAPVHGTECVPEPVRATVAAYWRDLGLRDAGLVDRLVEECLERAGRAPAEELERRALEEARRRYDHVLAGALGLAHGHDRQALAAARAACLFGGAGLDIDSLFAPGDGAAEWGARLRAVLPRSTPPEDHLPMPPAPLRFWLFKSPPPR